MDTELFEDLGLPQPAYHITDVHKKPTHGGQTAVMLEGCETAMIERKPRLVLVNGDANTNLAGALAARKLRLGVGHIEAGERSFDWRMPEEHNRRIMDHISDLLFTTNEKSVRHLRNENVMGEIHVTGNTIVDASINHAVLAKSKSDIGARLLLEPNGYILMTAHREENVDDRERLSNIIEGAAKTAEALGLPVLFPAHPRTFKRIAEFGLDETVKQAPGLRLIAALRYLDFMRLLIDAVLVLTDSGGVQQEAYIHRKPCVTLRDNTEWTETVELGANRLSGADSSEAIVARAKEAIASSDVRWEPVFGDGKAAERIVDLAVEYLDRSTPSGTRRSIHMGHRPELAK
jgi:UDP-N-acetylglucosamine 2-epimerase (non-hydrolysing)